jgi:hypothetical protein
MSEYSRVTAEDLLSYLNHVHPAGVTGECSCSICKAYTIILVAVGKIENDRAERRKEVAKDIQEVSA